MIWQKAVERECRLLAKGLVRQPKILCWLKRPNASGILVKSAGETLRVAGEEAVLLERLNGSGG